MNSQQLQGRIIYMLVALVLLNLTYPLSEGSEGLAVIYAIVYLSALGIGVYIAAAAHVPVRIIAAVGGYTTIVTVIWNLNIDNTTLEFLTYIGFSAFYAMLTLILLRFIFQARQVTRDVIYAAISVYLLLGNFFIPVYMMIEIITQETMNASAFVINTAPDTLVNWQRIAYFSYATLTTLGFGDITPITGWSQAFAAMQAIIGVLFITILIGRLVGVYAQEKPAAESGPDVSTVVDNNEN